MKYKILLITSLLFFNITTIDNASELFIAVLEQPQCEENSDLGIRVIFAKMNGEWISLNNQGTMKSYDFSKIKWTAAFDGRNIGQVQALNPKNVNYSKGAYEPFKTLQISQGANIPRILNKNEEFWGWCNAPKFRPLVLVSKPNFKDPARWKPFPFPKEMSSQLFPEYKKVVVAAKRCLTEQGSDRVSYDYQVQDLILFKSYQNELKQKLISIGLNLDLYKCDGIIDPQWKPYWFLIDNQIRYIGNELTIVDAGDYDNDGKSEVIFWHSGYNEDGYSLFFNNFNSRIDFYWKYH